MATLQKFKLLATQCAVSGGPTHSPATSPVIRLRRRKTLRMLLADSRRRMPRHDRSAEPAGSDRSADPPETTKELRVRRKLKDLFVSSPPLEDRVSGGSCEGQRLLVEAADGGNGRRRGGGASLRTLSTAFRHRLLKRAWRPVLVAIPEH